MKMYVITDERLKEIADAIRSKTGLRKNLSPSEMVEAIYNIVSETDIDGFIDRTATDIGSPTLTKIGANAFYNHTALNSVDFPVVRTIGNDAFNGCTSLTSLNLPSLAILGARVFNNCPNLTTLDLRETSLTAIPANCFTGSGLTTLRLPSSVFCSAVQNSFSGCPLAPGGTGGTIYMPSRFRTSYESNSGWSNVIGSQNNRIISY